MYGLQSKVLGWEIEKEFFFGGVRKDEGVQSSYDA